MIIAGKGHETYQEFADHTVPFDDIQVARRALENQPGGILNGCDYLSPRSLKYAGGKLRSQGDGGALDHARSAPIRARFSADELFVRLARRAILMGTSLSSKPRPKRARPVRWSSENWKGNVPSDFALIRVKDTLVGLSKYRGAIIDVRCR